MRDTFPAVLEETQRMQLKKLMEKLGVSEELPDYSSVNYWDERYTREKLAKDTWL